MAGRGVVWADALAIPLLALGVSFAIFGVFVALVGASVTAQVPKG